VCSSGQIDSTAVKKNAAGPVNYCYLDTVVGRLLLAGDAEGLSMIDFQGGPRPQQPDSRWREHARSFDDVISQLEEYFAGRRQQFDLSLTPNGTPFQQRVWRALLEVPYGATISYAQLAARIGQPTASRAVGLANGRNPLPIVIPCHRVIGADGKLTGYGGGLPIKERLIALEQGARRLIEVTRQCPM
jgi:methylated-DNA-[protein]-cysteine S-methyltransferase